MTLLPFSGQKSVKPQEPMIQKEVAETQENSFVEEVSIFSEDSQAGKSRFSVLLRTDLETQLSSRPRRNVEVSGLFLGVEEKEIPILARLAGRRIGILLQQRRNSVDQQILLHRIQALEAELAKVQKTNEGLRANLHMVIEQSREVS